MPLPNDVKGSFTDSHRNRGSSKHTPLNLSFRQMQGYVFAHGGVSGQTNDPFIEVISPAAGSVITPMTMLVIAITRSSETIIKLSAAFQGIPGAELVYDGLAYTPLYPNSVVEKLSTDKLYFHIERDGGWPGAPSLTAYITK